MKTQTIRRIGMRYGLKKETKIYAITAQFFVIFDGDLSHEKYFFY